MADHTDGMLPHLAARDVTMLAVSRAPLAEIEAFKKRMGWHFEWVSSNGSDFNHDFHVSFTEKEVASGKVDYNYTQAAFRQHGSAGHQRLSQGRRWFGLPHLFGLWPGRRTDDGNVSHPRSDA